MLGLASPSPNPSPDPDATLTPKPKPYQVAQCALPLALWQIDVRLLRFLNPQISWPENATSLQPNYRAEYDDR